MTERALVGAVPAADAAVASAPQPPSRFGHEPAPTTIPGMQAPGPPPSGGGVPIPEVAPQFAGAPNVAPPHGRVKVLGKYRRWPKRLVAVFAVCAVAAFGAHWYLERAEAAARKNPADAQAELRRAINAQRTYFSTHLRYEADAATMREVNDALDWGGDLKVVVNNADASGETSAVCMWERSSNGKTFSIATTAALGKETRFGTEPCPSSPSEDHVNHLDTAW